GITLVRVGRVEPLPPSPAARPLRALPAPQYPVFRGCGNRHAPIPFLNPYSRPITPWTPEGDADADRSPLARDSASAWTWGGRRPLLPAPRARGPRRVPGEGGGAGRCSQPRGSGGPVVPSPARGRCWLQT